MPTIKRGILRSSDSSDVQKYIGKGFAWPLRVGADGRLVSAEGTEHIKSCVHRNALYPKGGYPGIWDFGGGLFDKVFAVSTSSTFRQTEETVSSSVKTYEPRVKSVQAVVGQNNASYLEMVCTVIYEVIYTNRTDSKQINGLTAVQE